MKTLSEPVNREIEVPENAPTTDVLPEEDAVTVVSPSTRSFLELSHRLGSRGESY